MATYHMDPTATGNNDGTSATDAWQTLQGAIDGLPAGTQPVAGDIVLCYTADGDGDDESPTAPIDADGNSGDSTSGPIIFRGVDKDGVNTGARYNIGGASLASGTAILLFNGMAETQWENFDVHDASGTKHGIEGTNYGGSANNRFVNCYSHDNGGIGLDGASAGLFPVALVHCRIEGNTGKGIFVHSGAVISYCTIIDNGGVGIDILSGSTGAVTVGCVLHNNTGNNLQPTAGATAAMAIIGNVIDSAGVDGIAVSTSNTGMVVILNNRITNSTTDGIDADELSLIGWNYFDGNTTDISGTAALTTHILDVGSDTNVIPGSDTEEGYTSVAGNDFNLRSDATIRATEIDLDGTNSYFVSAGLEPAEPAAGGNVIIQSRRSIR